MVRRVVPGLIVLAILLGGAWITLGKPGLPRTDDVSAPSVTTPAPSAAPSSATPSRPPATSPVVAPPPPTTVPPPVAALPRPNAKGVVTLKLRKAVRSLPIVAEDRQPYTRSLFGGWIDANKNCRNTRDEVLVRDSRTRVTNRCSVYGGTWLSYYDKKTWRKSFQVQVDHLVPLAEAWDSGGYEWDAATRVRFANDLGDKRTLVPVTAALNGAKEADDPASWMPPKGRCRYVAEWVAVKLRWRLSADKREHAKVAKVAKRCPDTSISFKHATIGRLLFATGKGTASKAVTIKSILVRPAAGKYESVTLANGSASAVRLVGWVLLDRGGAQYRIPDWTLPARGSVVVHGGAGSNRPGHLYARWGSVWNDTGDTAYLRDGTRKVTDTCTYAKPAGRTVRC